MEAYEELLGLANNKLENFILIPNFYLVQEVLDLVTDAQAGKNANKYFSLSLLICNANYPMSWY